MSLSGSQVATIADALINAYNLSSLSIMVRTRMDVRLDTVTLGKNFTDIVYDLIDWAEQEDSVLELIREAQAETPDNAKLTQLYADSQKWTFSETPPSSKPRDNATRDKIIRGDEVGGDKFTGDKVMRDKHEHRHYHLSSETKPSGPPMMALAPPDDFVQRLTEYNQLIDYLLSDNDQPVAITATIRGAGGFGKTTLAQALCRDERIQAAFPDGVLWTTVGDEKTNVLQGLRKFYRELTGKEAQFVDEHDATTQLSNVLSDLHCLIVIDDVWNAVHLKPFLEGGESCARLVTTRIASVVPKRADVISLDAMQIDEATTLLRSGLDGAESSAFRDLAQRLGEWPLLLKLVNRRLYEDVIFYDAKLADAIADVNDELDAGGVTSFDVENAEEREQAVAISFSVSLKRLKADEAERFSELAIFPEDTSIPMHVLSSLWQKTGSVTERATERLCRRMAGLGLILRYDARANTILLHDVTRHYLKSQASNEQYQEWQNALLESYRIECEGRWWQLTDDGYIYQHLLWHMAEAHQQNTVESLLLTYHWLDAKLNATDIVSLINDFSLRHDRDRYSQPNLLKHALQMSMFVLARDKEQLVSQLYGRLGKLGEQWKSFVNELALQDRTTWLQPRNPSLTSPGDFQLFTFRDHLAGVSNLISTDDGRIITSCSIIDHTVKIWDVQQGILLHSLENHIDSVTNLLLTPEGYLISSASNSNSSKDTTIKIWNIKKGELLHSLEGHSNSVDKLLLVGDRWLITSCRNHSTDTSIKIWDLRTGLLKHSLGDHIDSAHRLLLSTGEHLISSSYNVRDNKINVWDLNQGKLLYSVDGHIDGASQMLLTENDQLISSGGPYACNDYTVKVWHIKHGKLLHSLEGHSASVDNLLLTGDGRLITSCSGGEGNQDCTIKVWNIDNGKLLHSLDGHKVGVTNLLLSKDMRLISSCCSHHDSTIKIWDTEQGELLHSLKGHSTGADNLLLTSSGWLISSCSSSRHGTEDWTVKVWDIDLGILRHSLDEHIAGVTNLLLTDDGRLITSCKGTTDFSVKIWDIEHGIVLRTLVGHIAGVDNLLLTEHGKLITSCSLRDNSIRVWDIDQKIKYQSTSHTPDEMHVAGVDNLLLTGDGRLITSCSNAPSNRLDYSVKVWDIQSGLNLYSLEGHVAGVDNLLLTGDGRLITSCRRDSVVYIWNIDTGNMMFSLEGHEAGVSNQLLTNDGQLIITSRREDYVVFIWDIERGIILHELERQQIPDLWPIDDESLYIAWCKRIVQIWDINHDTLVNGFSDSSSSETEVLLTEDWRLIVSSIRFQYAIEIWDAKQNIRLHRLRGHTYYANNLLLVDKRRLITSCSSYDSSVKIWNIDEGRLIYSLEGHLTGVDRLLATDNGKLITYCHGTSDMSVKIWDIDQGRLLLSINEHISEIQDTILWETRESLVIVSGDRISVWDLVSLQRVTQFTSDATICACTLAKDTTIIAGDVLGNVHFLNLVEADVVI